MKKIISLLLFLIVFSSCKKELIEKPRDLISKDKMTEILYDLSVLYASKGVNSGQINDKDVAIENFIYEQYGVDSTRVANSTIYYSSKPDEYLKMYEEIQQRLKAAKDTIVQRRQALKKSDSVTERDKFKADSLERERELREFIDTSN